MPLQQPDSVSIGSVLSPCRIARHDWKRIQGPMTGLQSNSRIQRCPILYYKGQGTPYHPSGLVTLLGLVA